MEVRAGAQQRTSPSAYYGGIGRGAKIKKSDRLWGCQAKGRARYFAPFCITRASFPFNDFHCYMRSHYLFGVKICSFYG